MQKCSMQAMNLIDWDWERKQQIFFLFRCCVYDEWGKFKGLITHFE